MRNGLWSRSSSPFAVKGQMGSGQAEKLLNGNRLIQVEENRQSEKASTGPHVRRKFKP